MTTTANNVFKEQTANLRNARKTMQYTFPVLLHCRSESCHVSLIPQTGVPTSQSTWRCCSVCKHSEAVLANTSRVFWRRWFLNKTRFTALRNTLLRFFLHMFAVTCRKNILTFPCMYIRLSICNSRRNLYWIFIKLYWEILLTTHLNFWLQSDSNEEQLIQRPICAFEVILSLHRR
jgi:hypothetical protein